MSFAPINLYKTRKETDIGEGKQVTVKPKETAKVKVFSFPAFNRPVIGYIIGPTEATIYINKRSFNFVYALIGYTFGWIDLTSTEIVGVDVERNEFGGYRFIWRDTRKEETEQNNSTEETGTEVKTTKPRGRKPKAETAKSG